MKRAYQNILSAAVFCILITLPFFDMGLINTAGFGQGGKGRNSSGSTSGVSVATANDQWTDPGVYFKRVRANRAWTSTGLRPQPGSIVKIKATGEVEVAPPDHPNRKFHRVPPEGANFHPGGDQPKIWALSLMGQIGNGAVFPIGTTVEFVTSRGGELRLGINDWHLDDNTGAWNVTIEIAEAPSDQRKTRLPTPGKLRSAAEAVHSAFGLTNEGKHTEAIGFLEHAEGLGLKEPKIQYLKGVAYTRSGDFEKAIAELTEAGKMGVSIPLIANCLLWRGYAYKQLGKLEEALKSLDEAVRLEPGHIDQVRERGRTYMALGRFEPAVGDFTKQLEAAEDDGERFNALHWRGYAYDRLGKNEKALADYDAALLVLEDPDGVLTERRKKLIERMGQ